MQTRLLVLTHCAAHFCLAPLQDCPEKLVFDAVMRWAGYGRDLADDDSACRPMQARTGQGHWQGCNTKKNSGQRAKQPRRTELVYATAVGAQDVEELLPFIRFPLMTAAELQAVG